MTLDHGYKKYVGKGNQAINSYPKCETDLRKTRKFLTQENSGNLEKTRKA